MNVILELAQELEQDKVEIGKLVAEGLTADEIRSKFTETEEPNFFPDADESNYSYDGVYYYFYNIKNREEPFKIHAYQFHDMIRDYVHDGRGMTMIELGAEHEIDTSIIEACFKRYGINKYSDTTPRERLEYIRNNHDINSYIQDEASIERKSYIKALDKARIKHLSEELKKSKRSLADQRVYLAEINEGFMESFDKYKAPPEIEKFVPKTDFMWNAGAFIVDSHHGKYISGKDSYGRNYNLEISLRRDRQHTDDLVNFIQNQGGTCDTIYVGDLGDTLHSQKGHTATGTEVGQDTTDRVVFRGVSSNFRYKIDRLRQVSNRVVWEWTEGNHNPIGEFYLHEYLKGVYEDCEDVVFNDLSTPQTYFRLGETIHLLDHGKGISKNIDSDKAKITLTNVVNNIILPEDRGYSNIVAWLGHLHSAASVSDGSHIKIIRLEPFCESDEWSSENRWGGDPCFHFYVFDDKGRPVQDHVKYFK